jgi:hypothetical protein
MITALSAPVVNPAFFVSMTFGTIVSGLVVPSVVNVWSGIGTTTFLSQSWTGLGALLGISASEDGVTVEARGLSLSLSGLDPVLLPAALSDLILGLPISIYMALYDSSNTLIASPVCTWAGRMDQPTFDVSPAEVILTIACETRLLDMNISCERRYTQEDQQALYPGDLGFQFVDGLQEKNIYWGVTPLSAANI